jgi:ankyrin repeat protein
MGYLTLFAGCFAENPATLSTFSFPPGPRQTWRAGAFFSDPEVLGLVKAIEKGDLAAIDRAASSGVDLNARGDLELSPLSWAFLMQNKPSFERLLELGADPNTRIFGGVRDDRPRASFNVAQDPPIELKPDVDKTAESGVSLVELAAVCNDDSDWLEMLLRHHADPSLSYNEDLDSPLQCAIWFQGVGPAQNANITLLLDAGADLNHQNRLRFTAALHAINLNRYDIA